MIETQGHLDPGTTVADRYTIEALLGAGGLAEVYRVRHMELGSLHALKLLTWRRKSLADRLLLEGRIQAQLRHPNVVAVSDVVRFDGQVGLLMEYVDGTTLDQLLAAKGALSWHDALTLFVPILSGVACAHDANVLHRDLKPANVLLARTATGWVPKVADFGIAKVVEDEMGRGATGTGVSMGTPGYMAPEQVRDSATVDQRTDIFALASILYEMLAGRKTFADPLGRLDVGSTLTVVPRPLVELAPNIEPRVSEAIAKAFSPEREDRFDDCRAFASALGLDVHPLLGPAGERAGGPLSLDPRSFPPPTGNPKTGPKPGGPTLEPPAEATLFTDTPGGVAPATAPPQRRAPWVVPVFVGLVGLGAMGLLVAGLGGVWLARSGTTEPGIPAVADIAPPPAPPAPVEVVTAPAPAPVVVAPPPASAPEVTTRTPAPAPVVAAVPVPVPAPVPDTTTDDAVALVEEPAAATPPPAPVDMMARLGGRWTGKADGRPFELRFVSADARAVQAESVSLAGATTRNELLFGTFDPASGQLSLASRDGSVRFLGTLKGSTLSGTYSMGKGKSLPWSVSR